MVQIVRVCQYGMVPGSLRGVQGCNLVSTCSTATNDQVLCTDGVACRRRNVVGGIFRSVYLSTYTVHPSF